MVVITVIMTRMVCLRLLVDDDVILSVAFLCAM